MFKNPRTGKEYADENEWHDSLVDPTVKRAIDEMVPWEWQEVICGCYSGWGSRDKDDNGQPRPCNRCGKTRRQYFACCTGCKEWYVTLFSHSEKSTASKRFDYGRYTKRTFKGACWTCLVGYYGKSETDVPPPAWATPREARSLDDLLADETEFDLSFDF